MSTKTNTRKILVPLATLLVAAAVAVGSGATFSSTTGSAITATAGTLGQVNSQDAATLTVTDLKPGVTRTGSLTITNNGSLDSILTMVPSGAGDNFVAGAVTLSITSVDGASLDPLATPVEVDWSGNFKDLTDTLTLGDLAGDSGESITVNFEVAMADSAGNANQGGEGTVSLAFVTTQTEVDNETGGTLQDAS